MFIPFISSARSQKALPGSRPHSPLPPGLRASDRPLTPPDGSRPGSRNSSRSGRGGVGNDDKNGLHSESDELVMPSTSTNLTRNPSISSLSGRGSPLPSRRPSDPWADDDVMNDDVTSGLFGRRGSGHSLVGDIDEKYPGRKPMTLAKSRELLRKINLNDLDCKLLISNCHSRRYFIIFISQ